MSNVGQLLFYWCFLWITRINPTRENIIRPTSETPLFHRGIRNMSDLDEFINSRKIIAREEVYTEFEFPNRPMMASENGKYRIICRMTTK